MNYNPFRQLQQQEHPLYKIFHVLQGYLSGRELVCLSLLNSSFHERASEAIWNTPDFERFAYIHDALYMFNRFLAHVSTVCPTTTLVQRVRAIRVARMTESLYERVNPQWSEILARHCTQLTHLDVSHTDFFSVLRGTAPPHLTHLDVSYCAQVTDDVLVQIARTCRQLVEVRMDGLARHKGRGLACLAAECDQLTLVSARHNTSMTDEAVVAVAKFRHVRLRHLDLTGCTKVTTSGLHAVARFCAHLDALSLTNTVCGIDQLEVFRPGFVRHIKALALSGLKRCTADDLAAWLQTAPVMPHLVDVTVDMAVAVAVVVPIVSVKRLVLTRLQDRTPWSSFQHILTVFPCAREITLVRAYFESDFLLGVYRTPSPEVQETITDAKLQHFNISQTHVVTTVIREREDNLDCSLLNW